VVQTTHHLSQVPLIDDSQMVQALSAQRAYHSSGYGVGLGRLDRGKYGPNGKSGCSGVEVPSIVAVAITTVNKCAAQIWGAWFLRLDCVSVLWGRKHRGGRRR
jgi:hypothetical protein